MRSPRNRSNPADRTDPADPADPAGPEIRAAWSDNATEQVDRWYKEVKKLSRRRDLRRWLRMSVGAMDLPGYSRWDPDFQARTLDRQEEYWNNDIFFRACLRWLLSIPGRTWADESLFRAMARLCGIIAMLDVILTTHQETLDVKIGGVKQSISDCRPGETIKKRATAADKKPSSRTKERKTST